ncbi:MAG TPA: hypothetical protein VFL66_00755 [Gaiellaceae bacterium]|nr:hypothetical protein [Gaiellaceae bacterium]
MTKSIRCALVAAAGACALALAGPALASYTPRLWVSNGPAVTLKVQVGAADDPTAKVTIYASPGYQLADPPPAGTKLGAVAATAQAVDLGGAILPLAGSLVAADPAQFTGPPSNTCSPGTHAQVWLLDVSAAGQTLAIPMYVDPTTGAAATFAPFTIQVCLPPPDVPAGTPGRAVFGAKLLSAQFSSQALIAAPGGGIWRSTWTPWTPKTGTPNPAGTVEAQARVGGAPTLTLSGRRSGRRKATLSAQLSPATAGARVAFLAGRKQVSSGKTTAGGDLAIVFARVRLTRPTSFVATATVPGSDLGSAGCAATVPGSPFPCVDATAAGSKATSKPVRLRP